MDVPARPLPRHLVSRYRGWRATDFAENAAWYARLATEGQRPRSMVISCCDSRVHVTSIFGADMGEFFIHRNIAGLVPPYNPDGDLHGTSAAVEYAVRALKVSSLLVMGHSQCGGVQGGYAFHTGESDAADSEFVAPWMELLRDGYANVAAIPDPATRLRALEKEAVTTGLRNLMSFPFVAEAVRAGDLTLHGLWNDIATGALEVYDPAAGGFAPV